eukprot:8021462-Pyramimonas_sp.AAC.1
MVTRAPSTSCRQVNGADGEIALATKPAGRRSSLSERSHASRQSTALAAQFRTRASAQTPSTAGPR